MPLPTFSVVVCAYTEERWDDLLDVLQSLREQTHCPAQVIAVVDHNESLLLRLQRAATDMQVIENQEARGLSGGRNTGLRAATAEVVAFIDDDATAEPEWLERLASQYRPEVMAVGGAVEPLWLGGRPAWFPEEFQWVVGCSYRGLPRNASPVRNLIGCNMSFRREVFQRIGGFRPGLGRIGKVPLGCEETELCIRATSVFPEATILYDPSARVHHRVPPSRTTRQYFRSRCYAEGLSKAVVARCVGAQDGLASERAYTLRTLPSGVLRGFGDTMLRADVAGATRSAAIIEALACTAWGYMRGRLAQRQAAGSPLPAIAQ
ncbi:MAG: glycosyltransferase family 2 protein [Chloroflexi bacterium]|nr:glycosyltransferase family 2 protein [Chloroflexota bacterium]